jgi:hypothetical protein
MIVHSAACPMSLLRNAITMQAPAEKPPSGKQLRRRGVHTSHACKPRYSAAGPLLIADEPYIIRTHAIHARKVQLQSSCETAPQRAYLYVRTHGICLCTIRDNGLRRHGWVCVGLSRFTADPPLIRPPILSRPGVQVKPVIDVNQQNTWSYKWKHD